MYDYLVVGAGLFGATFAHEAVKAGHSVLVVDKREHVGGNVYTESVAGIDVHRYGAHIFHTDDETVWNYVTALTPFHPYVHQLKANYKGRLYDMPFNMYTFSEIFGIQTPEEARAILEQERAEVRGEPQNLEEQAIALVGRTVYTKLVKGYTEKQWGRDCKDLPPSIIRRLPVRYIYDNNYFNDRFQGIPDQGYTALVQALLEGCTVTLNTNFLTDRTALEAQCKKVVYTGPLDEYYDYCYGRLEYRSLRFETELLDRNSYQGMAVVNYTDRSPDYTRIIEHKFFHDKNQPQTVITREYPAAWTKGMEPYYTVNDAKNTALHEQYAGRAREEGLLFGGRMADYQYYDMDDTIAAALRLAQEELKWNDR